MKAVLKLDGLCCANCAAKIENEVCRIDGVESASVSFVTQKLTINAPDDTMDAITEKASAIASRIDGDVTVKRIRRGGTRWTGSKGG